MSTLLINASANGEASETRRLAKVLINQLKETQQLGELTERDLRNEPLQLLSEAHVGAFFTPADDRSAEQKELLTLSEQYVKELKEAETLVIASPMYNFGVPAALKAWIDLICRAGETFKYTENGPVGLTQVKKTYVVVATGGTPIGSEMDFVTPYLAQIVKFLNLGELEFLEVDGRDDAREKRVAAAEAKIASI